MATRVPNLWAGIVIPMPFAALALLLRLKARRMTKMGLGYDDGLSVAAWALAVGYCTVVLVCVQHFKMGSKIGHLPESRIDYYHERINFLLWISEYLYSWSICLTKLAVLTFYRRIFSLLPMGWAILTLMVACGIWIIIRTFLTIFRCWPIEYFWDKNLDGRCIIEAGTYYFATDLAHTLLDCFILALPLFEVLKMRLPLGQKIAVAGLFSCGFFVCVASAFQIVEARKYDPTSLETPYEIGPAMTWAGVEINLALFASCMALLRPIFRKYLPGFTHSGDSSSSSHQPALTLHSSASHPRASRQDWS